jgi:predicted cation transporter
MSRGWIGLLVALAVVCACRRGPAAVPRLTGSGTLQVTVDAWARLSKPSGAIAVTSTGADDVPARCAPRCRDGRR